MYSSTVEDLYEAIETRGGLTSRMRLETLVADLQIATGTQPVETEDTTPDPCCKTLESPVKVIERPTWVRS